MAKNKHILIGQIGESVACSFLENRGFRLIERNYRKKWGEIDIIMEKDSVLHFIEVKSSSVKRFYKDGEESYRPEDHIHIYKKARLARTVETYLSEREIPLNKNFEVSAVVVLINEESKKIKIKFIQRILID